MVERPNRYIAFFLAPSAGMPYSRFDNRLIAMKTSLIPLLCAALCFCAQTAQTQPRGKPNSVEMMDLEYEMLKQRRFDMQLDTAIQLLNKGAYARADKALIDLISKQKKISSKLVYYFGKSSFYSGKYKQSIDWLSKYIALKGAEGEFSQDAVKYLKEAEKKLFEPPSGDASPAASTPSTAPKPASRNVDPCGPTGKITCPACNGTTVIVRSSYTESIYKTCPYCRYRGYLNCEEYQQMRKGKLKKNIYK